MHFYCGLAVMSAVSRGLTVFRRDVVVAWVSAFHPLVATLLMVTSYDNVVIILLSHVHETKEGWVFLPSLPPLLPLNSLEFSPVGWL